MPADIAPASLGAGPGESKKAVERQERLGKLEKSFIGFQAAFALLFWLPVFYTFQKKIGLADREILGIQSVYYVVFALFEIPTGYLADRLGRRLCARLGAFFLLLSNLIPVLLAELPGLSLPVLHAGMLAHFVVIALARSLVSGALSAYLYDALERQGRGAHYAAIEGKARSVGLLARILGWLGVGALMELRLSLPYVLTVGSALAAAYFAWGIPEGGEPSRKAQEKAQVGGLSSERRGMGAAGLPGLADVLAALRASPVLVLALFQGVAIFTLDRILLVNLFQPILGSKGFSIAQAGPMLAWVSFVEAFCAARVGFLQRRLLGGTTASPVALGTAVLGLSAVMGICLAGFALADRTGAWVLFSVYSVAAGFAYPLQRQAIQQAIVDSRMRATLVSLESLIDRSVCAVVAWILGESLAAGQLSGFLISAGLGTVVFGVVVQAALRFARRPSLLGTSS
jgi:MFS family permease